MTLQCAVYIVRSQGDRGDIIREVPKGDTIMEDEPYGRQYLSGHGYYDFHLAFPPDHHLVVAEAVEETASSF